MPTETSPRITVFSPPALSRWAAGFLLARRAEGRSPRTVESYKESLDRFAAYCEARSITSVEAVDAGLLREYLLALGERISANTVNKHFRVLRGFFRWYADEAAADGWRNPVDKVRPLKVDLPPLPAADAADVTRMLSACTGRNGLRDKAILLTLADVGLRAGELCGLRLGDFEPVTGALTVTRSKSRKPRGVYLGKQARRALRAYLTERGEQPGALFVSEDPRSQDGALTVSGLRRVTQHRARLAHVKPPPLHSFRRAAALAMVRNGADLLTVSRILGHANLTLLQRYVKQDAEDLRAAAERFSPGDRL